MTFAENVAEARAAIAVFTAPSLAGCFSRAWREVLLDADGAPGSSLTAKRAAAIIDP